jgi:hypothetical protein
MDGRLFKRAGALDAQPLRFDQRGTGMRFSPDATMWPSLRRSATKSGECLSAPASPPAGLEAAPPADAAARRRKPTVRWTRLKLPRAGSACLSSLRPSRVQDSSPALQTPAHRYRLLLARFCAAPQVLWGDDARELAFGPWAELSRRTTVSGALLSVTTTMTGRGGSGAMWWWPPSTTSRSFLRA